MGKSETSSSTGKRPRPDNTPDPADEKLLANNRFAVLENAKDPEVVEKEKIPPFYVKSFPEGLREAIVFYIDKGSKCTIRICTEGYKLMVPSLNVYKAVQVILQKHEVEYFSHDIEAENLLKVVLRGLPDMEVDTLLEELKANGLKPIQIYKMTRHNKTRKYRDLLYLVPLEKNSTCLTDLQSIRALIHIIVAWERYKPVHRDDTQCSNCLMFGHGTKSCHMAYRCIKCRTHPTPAN
ncbi:uncharacterized protein LOC129728295 [Wyeomyia smithii]|uniref:uncharacterized protein LOC129728295 n=1 Tax=Wyeomyia smithii TaxID=174621 RepID=UPI002467E371|nr:uncharacterized protein LOC129728295 [Wyeomyia smithii]